MQRVTITIDDDLAAELDGFMAGRGYANRSEAIRDLARSGLQQAATEVAGSRPCVAALVYMYDHEARELPKRLTRDFHERHDLAHTTLQGVEDYLKGPKALADGGQEALKLAEEARAIAETSGATGLLRQIEEASAQL